MSAKVERLPGTVKCIEEIGLHEVGSRSRGAVKQQNPIGDCAIHVATRLSENSAPLTFASNCTRQRPCRGF
jgi:hypothetical protein